MKLLLCILTLICFEVHAANPSFQSFDANSFVVAGTSNNSIKAQWTLNTGTLSNSAAATTSNMVFNSTVNSSGNLVEFKKMGVPHLSIAPTNGIVTSNITAYSGTPKPWQFGSVVSNATVTANLTNYVEVTIGGKLYKLLISN